MDLKTTVVMGETYKDKVSGFIGKAICVSFWKHEGQRVILQPHVDDENTMLDDEGFHIDSLEPIDHAMKETTVFSPVTFGEEYTDKVSGFKGKCVCVHKWQFGCLRILLQPAAKDNKMHACKAFDEPALSGQRDEAPKTEQKPKPPGGPRDDHKSMHQILNR